VYGDMELLSSAAAVLLGNYDPRDPTQVRRQALGRLAFLEFPAMRELES
jgi:hypothetical protein